MLVGLFETILPPFFGVKIFLLDQKEVKNFKKRYFDMNKIDEIDAFVVVDYLRFFP